MRISPLQKRARAAYTIVELVMAMAASSIVLVGLTAGSVALQRSFAAISDYATADNDMMRISDYLAVDMRRAKTVTPDNNGGVTVVLPNYYNTDGTPKSPTIVSTMGWPQQQRKKKKNKHKNIIMAQSSSYDPASTQTVKYYKGNSAAVGKDSSKFYREVGGVAKVIANDIADFSVTINDSGDTATTAIKFVPRFRMSPSSDASTASTVYTTTLLRNQD